MTDILELLDKYRPYNKLHGQAAKEIRILRSYRDAAFVLKEGELLVVKVPDWITHLDLNEIIKGLPEDLRKRTVLLRGLEAVRGE